MTALSPMQLGILILALFVLLGVFIYLARKHSDKDLAAFTAQKDEPDTVDGFVEAHGEPEAVVVLDATRSNELNYVVLVYENELIVNGEPIERGKITNVTFNNANNPYVNSDYQLVLTTTIPDKTTVRTRVGSDSQWASEVATQLAQYI